MSEHKAILAKMAAVMKDVQYIKKDAKNKFGGYNYASERAIKEHVGKALRDHGIIFQLNQGLPMTIQSQYEDKNGKPKTGTVLYVPCEYHFWDSESGECLSGTFNGAGHVREDKGFYAATTGAIKYILTSTFLIATGDDPETDNNSPAPVQQTADASTPKQSPPQQSGGQQDDGFEMQSKFGEETKKSRCHYCGQYHILKGDLLIKQGGKWGAKACWEKNQDDLPF